MTSFVWLRRSHHLFLRKEYAYTQDYSCEQTRYEKASSYQHTDFQWQVLRRSFLNTTWMHKEKPWGQTSYAGCGFLLGSSIFSRHLSPTLSCDSSCVSHEAVSQGKLANFVVLKMGHFIFRSVALQAQ